MKHHVKEEQPLVGQIKSSTFSWCDLCHFTKHRQDCSCSMTKRLSKLVEFPTEGTPNSLAVTQKIVYYITDQNKNRILIIEPKQRKFLGQIDLPPKTTPKGIASLYQMVNCCTCLNIPANNIDVIETENNKVSRPHQGACRPFAIWQ